MANILRFSFVAYWGPSLVASGLASETFAADIATAYVVENFAGRDRAVNVETRATTCAVPFMNVGYVVASRLIEQPMGGEVRVSYADETGDARIVLTRVA